MLNSAYGQPLSFFQQILFHTYSFHLKIPREGANVEFLRPNSIFGKIPGKNEINSLATDMALAILSKVLTDKFVQRIVQNVILDKIYEFSTSYFPEIKFPLSNFAINNDCYIWKKEILILQLNDIFKYFNQNHPEIWTWILQYSLFDLSFQHFYFVLTDPFPNFKNMTLDFSNIYLLSFHSNPNRESEDNIEITKFSNNNDLRFEIFNIKLKPFHIENLNMTSVDNKHELRTTISIPLCLISLTLRMKHNRFENIDFILHIIIEKLTIDISIDLLIKRIVKWPNIRQLFVSPWFCFLTLIKKIKIINFNFESSGFYINFEDLQIDEILLLIEQFYHRSLEEVFKRAIKKTIPFLNKLIDKQQIVCSIYCSKYNYNNSNWLNAMLITTYNPKLNNTITDILFRLFFERSIPEGMIDTINEFIDILELSNIDFDSLLQHRESIMHRLRSKNCLVWSQFPQFPIIRNIVSDFTHQYPQLASIMVDYFNIEKKLKNTKINLCRDFKINITDINIINFTLSNIDILKINESHGLECYISIPKFHILINIYFPILQFNSQIEISINTLQIKFIIDLLIFNDTQLPHILQLKNTPIPCILDMIYKLKLIKLKFKMNNFDLKIGHETTDYFLKIIFENHHNFLKIRILRFINMYLLPFLNDSFESFF